MKSTTTLVKGEFRSRNHQSIKEPRRQNERIERTLKKIVELLFNLWGVFLKIGVPNILVKSVRNTWQIVYFSFLQVYDSPNSC